jgi:hypothetical protein
MLGRPANEFAVLWLNETNNLGRKSHHQRLRRDDHARGDHRAGGYHAAAADVGAIQHGGPHADQNVILNPCPMDNGAVSE